MSEKSHVGMGYHLCPVTGIKHTESVILDRRMKNTLDRDNFLGWKPAPDVQEKIDEGFIPIVEVDYEKSTKEPNGNIKPGGAWRTGKAGYIKTEAWERIFGKPLGEPMAFVEEGVIDALYKMQEK